MTLTRRRGRLLHTAPFSSFLVRRPSTHRGPWSCPYCFPLPSGEERLLRSTVGVGLGGVFPMVYDLLPRCSQTGYYPFSCSGFNISSSHRAILLRHSCDMTLSPKPIHSPHVKTVRTDSSDTLLLVQVSVVPEAFLGNLAIPTAEHPVDVRD